MKAIIHSGLYAITDCVNMSMNELIAKTETILTSGISMLQYREKEVTANSRIEIVHKLKQLCKQHNTKFIINDDVELAKEINADGVHIGKDDQTLDNTRKILGENAIIGVSCYNDIGLALSAETAGADYIAFGAFFPSKSPDFTN